MAECRINNMYAEVEITNQPFYQPSYFGSSSFSSAYADCHRDAGFKGIQGFNSLVQSGGVFLFVRHVRIRVHVGPGEADRPDGVRPADSCAPFVLH